MPPLSTFGGYALITGASSGLGAEFARQLAAAGVSCILTARREARLLALAQAIHERHQVATHVIPADLSREDEIHRLLHEVAGHPVGILINNAGFGDGGRFETRSPNRLGEMVRLNCLAPVLLTRALAPAMLERRRGAVVMVSSSLGLIGSPYEATYGASKAFDLSLGEALWGEFAERGVDVVTICPGSTATEFLTAQGMDPAVARERHRRADRPEDVVAATLAGLGRRPVVFARQPARLEWLRRVASRGFIVRRLGRGLARARGVALPE